MRARAGLRPRRRNREKGITLIFMAVLCVALFGVLGLAADIGRLFITKSETQEFCDAAAIAAALQLNGTTAGITAAQTAVSNSNNTWNFDSKSITGYTLDFATTSAGPWSTNPSPATSYIYARVRVTTTASLYFIPIVVLQQSQDVSSAAIAGQIAQPTLKQGLGPYTAVSTNTTDPNFGLVVGQSYDIQWPNYNGTRNGCSALTPDGCFVQPTCTGDSLASKAAVTQYWGASISGYWGSTSNSIIDQEVLDVIQLQPVSVGQYLTMTSGNKNAEAVALDTRVNQDGDLTDNTPSAYLSSSSRNGRRLMGVPIVDPTAAGTVVIGYGAFLLQSNGNPSNYYTQGSGNDPYCAVYAGAYTQGGTSTGAGNAGYYKVQLVQ